MESGAVSPGGSRLWSHTDPDMGRRELYYKLLHNMSSCGCQLKRGLREANNDSCPLPKKMESEKGRWLCRHGSYSVCTGSSCSPLLFWAIVLWALVGHKCTFLL